MNNINRENEKQVVEEICSFSNAFDYSKAEDLKKALSAANKRDIFKQSIFGMRYIKRLSMLSTGLTATDCVLCGKEAINNVVCNTCIQKLNQIKTKNKKTENKNSDLSISSTANNPSDIAADNYSSTNEISIEELFKDMDDSLLQLASQVTAKSIKRLTWINIAIGVLNFIVLFFLTLFLWKFITTT